MRAMHNAHKPGTASLMANRSIGCVEVWLKRRSGKSVKPHQGEPKGQNHQTMAQPMGANLSLKKSL